MAQASTWQHPYTIYNTQPSSSGMQQVFQENCIQTMASGSRMDWESGSSQAIESGAVVSVESGGEMQTESGGLQTIESGGIFKNENVTAYTTSSLTLAAVSGVAILTASAAVAHWKLPQPVKGLDITCIAYSTLKTFLQSTIAGTKITSTGNKVIKFTTQSAAGHLLYGRNCRLIGGSSVLWYLVAPTTLQVTLSSST